MKFATITRAIGFFLMGILFLPNHLVAGEENATEPTSTEEGQMNVQVIGNSFIANFGSPYIFKLNFESETAMSFVQVDVDGNAVKDALQGSVDITRVEIRPNVYMVYWTEPFNNDTTVTHVQDFENGHVWTNISTPGSPFVNLNGPLTLVRD